MNKKIYIALITLSIMTLLAGCDLFTSTPEPPQQSQDPPPATTTDPINTNPDLYSILEGPYYPFAQLENVVVDELGNGFRIADWNEFKSQGPQLADFVNAIKLQNRRSYFVMLQGKAHPDKVAASGVSAQHPGPAAFRYLAYRGPVSELETHFEDLIIVDDSLSPEVVLFQSWTEAGDILVVEVE